MIYVRKYFLWAILVGSFLFAYLGHPPLPCSKPIEYKIGAFDTRFGVSKADFISAAKSAEDKWEKSVGRNLFEYNPNGSLAINLIYDDRQATTQKNKVLESVANQNKDSAGSIKTQLDILEAQYKLDSKTYTDLLSAFQIVEAKYASDVAYYNAQGGAPKDEYNRLTVEKQSIADQGAVLEAKRVALNSLGEKINVLVKEHNTFIDVANGKINTLNQSAGKEFNEGEYVEDSAGVRINIYEFTSKEKLTRILEHELGHALGLEHGSDPQAIMYYLNQGENLVPTAEDKASVLKICTTQMTYLQKAYTMIQSYKTASR